MCNFNVYNFIIATVSIIAAIIVGTLFYFEFIANIFTILIILAVIATILLLIILALLFLPYFNCKTLMKCICKFANAVILGSIGTVIALVAAIAVPATAGSIISAIVVFLAVLFFTVALLGFLFLLNCVLCSKCARYENNQCDINDNENSNECNCRFMD